jgi:hypothetical protein
MFGKKKNPTHPHGHFVFLQLLPIKNKQWYEQGRTKVVFYHQNPVLNMKMLALHTGLIAPVTSRNNSPSSSNSFKINSPKPSADASLS